MSEGELQRYKMVYLSYYALYCVDQADRVLLMDKLVADGTMTEEASFKGIASVKSPRLRDSET